MKLKEQKLIAFAHAIKLCSTLSIFRFNAVILCYVQKAMSKVALSHCHSCTSHKTRAD